MKGSRDDDKVMDPLFPRLHVSDVDKGGPRAPPRNKMALYELFSIPSQRVNSEAASALPLPTENAGCLVPSSLSSQTVSSQFSVPPHIPAHMEENAHLHSVEGTNQKAMRVGLERKLQKHDSQRLASVAGNVQVGVECSSLHQNDLSRGKYFSGKKFRDEDDLSVPICVQRGISLLSDKDHHSIDRERRTHFHLSSLQKNGATAFSSQSQRVQSSHGKPFKWYSSNVSMTRKSERSGEGQARETVTQHESTEFSMPHPAIREDVAEPSNICKPPSDQEHPCCKLSELGSLRHGGARICQESNGNFGDKRCLSNAEVIKKQGISNGGSRSCSKISLDNISKTSLDNNLVESSIMPEHCSVAGINVDEAEEDAERTRSPVDAEKITLTGDANKDGKPEDADRNNDSSETSMVDSLPRVGISPDDVVGIISPKHFWKARRAMANQQRVFAVQVFELHRLIKVQKLIAASPHLLLQDTSYLHISPMAPVKALSASFLGNTQLQTVGHKDKSYKVNNSECATEKTASADTLVKSQLHIVKQKDVSHKVNCNMESPTENSTGILPLPRELCKRPVSQLPKDTASSESITSFLATSDSKQGARCFQPPDNQWLIPVMSPSEGLVYKPYAGPRPPVAFMAPVYSGCAPLNVAHVDIMCAGFGISQSHQQQNIVLSAAPVAPSYLPASHGLPLVNPVISGSPVEQVRPMADPWSSGQLEQHSWSSCNMSNPRSKACSERAQKVHISEVYNLQGSTASCPSDRVDAGRDALHLFPMAESAECSGCPPQARGRDHQTRVIKVVPHNARSATESAARIFQSIQNERQQHDSV